MSRFSIKVLGAAAVFGLVVAAAGSASAMPAAGLKTAAAQVSTPAQDVRWICGPYRCWWRPGWGYYGPRVWWGHPGWGWHRHWGWRGHWGWRR